VLFRSINRHARAPFFPKKQKKSRKRNREILEESRFRFRLFVSQFSKKYALCLFFMKKTKG
jgi:hypothetical protein